MIIKTQEEFNALPVGSVSVWTDAIQYGIVLQRTVEGWVNISFTSYTPLGHKYPRTNGVIEFPREVFLPENVVSSAAEADILPLGTVMWREDAEGWLADDSVKTENGWTIINPEWLSAGVIYKSGVYGYPRRYSLPNKEDYILKEEVTMNALKTDVSPVKHYPKFEFSLSRAEWASWQSSVDWSEYTSMSIIALTQEEAIDKARAVATPRSGYTWVFKVIDVRELGL